MFEANQDVFNTRFRLPYYRLAVELKLVLMKSLQPENVCKLTNLAYKAFKMLGLSHLLKRLRFTTWQLDDASSKQRIFAKKNQQLRGHGQHHVKLSIITSVDQRSIVICVIEVLI